MRITMREFLVLMVMCATAAVAGPMDDVKVVLGTNCPITVDKRFSGADIDTIIAAGRGRITVICSGFTAEDAKRFASKGAIIVVDASHGVNEVINLARAFRNRVRVDGATVSADTVKQAQAAGALILAGTGGSSASEKAQTINRGGQCVADSSLPVRDVMNLIAAGRNRVHVIATGFSTGDVRSFVQTGAIVWVDPSFKPEDVVSLARAGKDRLIVRAAGFPVEHLKSFGQAGAHVVFAFDRAKARASTFEQMFGKPN
jgi:hypothetical protein